MFEDFRKQIDDNAFPEVNAPPPPAGKKPINDRGYFLGMTAVQRFFVALILLVMTVILGLLFLMVTSKIALPPVG